jgi:L-lysine 2,3-aminomutase
VDFFMESFAPELLSAIRPAQAKTCPPWQESLAEAVRTPAELCQLAGLPAVMAAEAEQAATGFPVLVPKPFLARIRQGDPDDPLLVQVLPRQAELAKVPRYTSDPLGESDASHCPGLLSKYEGRSLMVTTGCCAVHCRFCCRRHFPFHTSPQTLADWEPALRRIAAEKSIEEIILSGGDPLTLSDPYLAQLVEQLAKIPHLRRLRVHTRLPALIPQRVTGELLDWLRGTRLTSIVVIHVNHPAEIDSPVATALSRLIEAGVPVLSQSVLLRGVNDRVDTLVQLFRRLVDLRVMPYYLHQLDPIAGVAHFEVPEATGIELMARLRAWLPGYVIPRYVREIAGKSSKVVLA